MILLMQEDINPSFRFSLYLCISTYIITYYVPTGKTRYVGSKRVTVSAYHVRLSEMQTLSRVKSDSKSVQAPSS